MITFTEGTTQYSWSDGSGPVSRKTVESLIRRGAVAADDPGLVEGCPQTIGIRHDKNS